LVIILQPIFYNLFHILNEGQAIIERLVVVLALILVQ